jgi:hypothetical protein
MRCLVPAGAAAGLFVLALACVPGIPERPEQRPSAAPQSVMQPSRHRGRIESLDDRTVAEVRGHAREGRFEAAWDALPRLTAAGREEMAALLVSLEAASHPLSAFERASSLMDGDLRDTCRVVAIRHGSDAFLPDLVEIVASASDFPHQEALIGELIARWAVQDPAGLSQWPRLASMSARVRDEAASQLLAHGDSLNVDPVVAAAWAMEISDPGLRQAALDALARNDGDEPRPAFVDPDAGMPSP